MMADTKISALPASTTPLAGTEVLPIVQGSTTKQVTVANLTAGRAVSMLSATTTSGFQFRAANATNYELLRYVGGTNNPGIFVNVNESSNTANLWLSGSNTAGQVLGIGAAGVTDVLKIGDSNVTLTYGNLVQGTAAKGFNFTANTAASGKTSQLLNWYEEGTWTPTWNGGTVTVNYATYTRVGRLVTLVADITFGASATGTDSTLSVPFNVASNWGTGAINYTDVSAAAVINIDKSSLSGAGAVLVRTALNSANYSCASLATKRLIFSATYIA
jgi:hypothetical protein